MTAFATFCTGFARRWPHPDEYPTQSWDQKCALLMARIGLAKGGLGWKVPPRSYGDAAVMAAATNARTKLNKNSRLAPIGAFHFWTNHVGVDVNGGGTSIFMATTHIATKIESAIGYQSEAGYTKYARSIGWKYLGWADNYNGGKYRLPAETPSATQRVVGKIGANVRKTPSTVKAAIEVLAPGSVQDVLGWEHGQKCTVEGITTDIWLSTKDGWTWAGGYTSQSTDHLKDLNPDVPPPAVPPTPDPAPVPDPISTPDTPTAGTTAPDAPDAPPAPDEKPTLPGAAWVGIIAGAVVLLTAIAGVIEGWF